MTEKLKGQIKFLVEADKMKSISRQTLLIDKSRAETDAEHSWHFALMAMTLFEYSGIDGIDLGRVMKMAIVHDLVEIYAGDTFAYDKEGYADKEEREKAAAGKLFALLPDGLASEYRELWEEFDRMDTPDSKYAAAVDRLQPLLNNYMTDGHPWAAHGVSGDDIYKRMEPIRTALPELWEFVEFVISDSREKGFVK